MGQRHKIFFANQFIFKGNPQRGPDLLLIELTMIFAESNVPVQDEKLDFQKLCRHYSTVQEYICTVYYTYIHRNSVLPNLYTHTY